VKPLGQFGQARPYGEHANCDLAGTSRLRGTSDLPALGLDQRASLGKTQTETAFPGLEWLKDLRDKRWRNRLAIIPNESAYTLIITSDLNLEGALRRRRVAGVRAPTPASRSEEPAWFDTATKSAT
jgi:hypothetical protein